MEHGLRRICVIKKINRSVWLTNDDWFSLRGTEFGFGDSEFQTRGYTDSFFGYGNACPHFQAVGKLQISDFKMVKVWQKQKSQIKIREQREREEREMEEHQRNKAHSQRDQEDSQRTTKKRQHNGKGCVWRLSIWVTRQSKICSGLVIDWRRLTYFFVTYRTTGSATSNV